MLELLEVLGAFATLIGIIDTFIGALVVAYFLVLSLIESPRWAWNEVFVRPYETMRMRRRVREMFEDHDERYFQGYAKFDVEMTRRMYGTGVNQQDIYIFPKGQEPYSPHSDPETVGFDPNAKPPFKLPDHRFRKEDMVDQPNLRAIINEGMLRPNEIRKKGDDGILGSDHGNG